MPRHVTTVALLSVALAAVPSTVGQQPDSEQVSIPAAVATPVRTRMDFTIGGVFVDTDGSRDKFFTDQFIRSGVNVTDASIDFLPIEGADTLFDFARVTAFGLGDSSPHQRGDFRISKRKLYDLKAGYRKYNYFFGLPSFALGLHSENSVGRAAHGRLELWPKRKASLILRYRRNQLYGTAFSSQELRFDTYPVSFPRRLSSDEFGVGTHLRPSRQLSLQLEQSFIRLKNDRQLFSNPFQAEGLRGNTLVEGQRDAPTRISTPASRAIVRYEPNQRFEITGRYLYSKSSLNEINRWENLLQRIGEFQLPVRQTISSSGFGEKPTQNADVTNTIEITDRLALHNDFKYITYTISGFLATTGRFQFINEDDGNQIDLPFQESGGTATDYSLGSNLTELDFAVTRRLSLIGGYRYSDRHLAFGDISETRRPVKTITHAGLGGFSWIHSSKGRVRAEVEKGASNKVFNRIEPLQFLRWKVNGQIRPAERLTISGNATVTDNRNDTPGVNYDLDDRQVGAQATYVVGDDILISGGYNYYKIRTMTDILFFTMGVLSEGRSQYEMNTHIANVLVQFPVGKRLRLRAGYDYVQDRGQTFPLKFHKPRAGFSLRIQKRVSLEVDAQHYSYNEKAFTIQDYRANVLTTGLRFTF